MTSNDLEHPFKISKAVYVSVDSFSTAVCDDILNTKTTKMVCTSHSTSSIMVPVNRRTIQDFLLVVVGRSKRRTRKWR